VQLYAYTGDLGQAQDLVQEAFCRGCPGGTASTIRLPGWPTCRAAAVQYGYSGTEVGPAILVLTTKAGPLAAGV